MPIVKIVTDSTIDLPPQIIEENDLTVVPLSITIDGETYIDGIDISPREFITKMQKSENLPKSSQPTAGEFLEIHSPKFTLQDIRAGQSKLEKLTVSKGRMELAAE